jgi:hypothetical protein
MAFRGWKREPLQIASGEVCEALFPVIVSASRKTDIPAFYADWFFNRLRAGYLRWTNPYNPAQSRIVAMRDTRVFVFWSKNPQPMLARLDELDALGVNYVFQYTLNDYEAEGLEPGVPPLGQRIDTFLRLSERLGPGRVVWRFDPLILAGALDAAGLLAKVARLAAPLKDATRTLVFSFADIARYRSVQRNLKASGARCTEFTPQAMRDFARGLVALNARWGLRLATCAEAIDLSDLGIEHGRCIDARLMARLWPDDTALKRFLADTGPDLKDPGQRAECGCFPAKDIGRYRTCRHLCAYCYANGTPAEARRNAAAHDASSESL